MSVTFVSIGDGEKLTKFLELNPDLPKDRCFVDESRTFDVYRAAGFGKIGDTKPTDINIKPPGFSFGQWFSYLANVATLVMSAAACQSLARVVSHRSVPSSSRAR